MGNSTKSQVLKQLPPVAIGNGEEMDFGHIGRVPPLVPEADYQIGFVRAEKGRFKNRERLFIYFRIVSHGEHFGKELYLVAPCPSNGGRIFGLGSNLVAAATVALGHIPTRRDRLSTRMFRGKIFLAKTRTVKLDQDQDERRPQDHYSVIKKLLSVEAGA